MCIGGHRVLLQHWLWIAAFTSNICVLNVGDLTDSVLSHARFEPAFPRTEDTAASSSVCCLPSARRPCVDVCFDRIGLQPRLACASLLHRLPVYTDILTSTCAVQVLFANGHPPSFAQCTLVYPGRGLCLAYAFCSVLNVCVPAC